MSIDWNNPDEVRKYRAQKSREYRARVKARADAGDEYAQELQEKQRKRLPYNNCKTYIKNKATLKQLNELRGLILEREKKLKEK
ncbi:hypothetical protein L2Z99_00600 [Lactobacillus mulieris]|uniref:Uncharacterized protein n=1 Tax=Lactobacillus mulieris TaxID=2508708 RepID=A0AAW5WVW5_9LACO|nr:hypothetical protein [Lactobacillus mulieris]MCW8106821.1 hypothetical protein [Lactobacillus mulieris]MCZ9677579.1 hypothetical protein [Lactobacillus mulieris]MDK6563568.1 hypothetical protein [Lactobacillus mulieris]MDK7349592.1 hypothetical protein [Lactobacillus mulieris]MDK8082188.1 hypothetical protein [Lactobacillus mulieris]